MPVFGVVASEEGAEARIADLLPIEYFHVVFTIPAELARIAVQNKKVMYDILFRASALTLKEIAADSSHLGAKIGFIGLLHTWGQNLLHHPHVHYVIPGGGLSPDGAKWVPCRPGFFLPVRVLRALFRGKFLDLIRINAHKVDAASLNTIFPPMAGEIIHPPCPASGPATGGRIL